MTPIESMTFSQITAIINLGVMALCVVMAAWVGRSMPGFWSVEEPKEVPPEPEPFRPPRPSSRLFGIAFVPASRDWVVKVLIDHGARFEEALDTFILFRPQEGDEDLEQWAARIEPIGVYIADCQGLSVPKNHKADILGLPIHDPT